MSLRGTFDLEVKTERLEEVSRELEDSKIWDKPEQAETLGRERAALLMVVDTIASLKQNLQDCEDLLQMAIDDDDQSTLDLVVDDLAKQEAILAKLEFRRMFSGKMDH
jgi:peptide chain release factor 2